MKVKLNNILSCSIFCCMLCISSCSSDDIVSPEEQPVSNPAGAFEEDCKWIYSHMNHDYLWREDIPDSLDCNYGTDPVTFFKSLLSPKDRFSYCENNSSYTPAQEKNNLGYSYQTYETEEGKSFRQVLYVTCTELRDKGLRRGDIVVPTDTPNTIVRVRLDYKNTIIPVDTIEASDIFKPTKSVYLDSIYNINDRKVGYLCYLEFNEINELVPTLEQFYNAQLDEMILDLRYNPGGYVNTCKYLSNSIINEKGYNGIFQQCTYNDIITKELEKETGRGVSVNYFSIPDNGENVLGNPLYGLNLKRIFILTSKYSASASEAAIISLRPYMDVITIGEQTYGKGVGSWTVRDNKYRYQLQPITMRYHNALMETTPDDGIAADYIVLDGYSTSKKELGDKSEPLLAKALDLILGAGTSDDNEAGVVSSQAARKNSIKEKGTPSFFRLPPENTVYDNHLDSQENLHNDNTHN